ncbi:hypothetical protein CONCODRAFT_2132 [Conidiobolus coronatus NRRL 28638]|uniref:G-protein coupled receptors family 1 profile domain-containing protein n=1 Tax=Conidiobolus coronatus (strain ATCC 28846 / CBS 209.66 / NRRL 28638) TaxID=796925 RepID=A0A137PII2_CONC2|nr:hypothetical protein CONCODRAFT_2132 [Conidiobolus coronatus NRRL 28638]|eukprot:KXN74802.1 hypothetical protein CONCODRAFT_2132 [Conidiobolus coronatus NRRL 28638]
MSNAPISLLIPTLIISILSLILGIILFYVLLFRVRRFSSDKVIMIGITIFDLLWIIQKFVYDIAIFIAGKEVLRTEGIMLATLAMMRLFNGCLKINIHSFIWYIFALINVILSVGLGVYSYITKSAIQSASGAQCISFIRGGSFDKGLLIFKIIYLALGSIVILICYIVSTIYILKAISSSIIEAKANSLIQHEIVYKKQRFLVTINFIIIVIVYLLAFFPSVVTFILKSAYGVHRTVEVDTLIIVFHHLIGLINPLLTIYLHPETNTEFFKIFGIKL